MNELSYAQKAMDYIIIQYHISDEPGQYAMHMVIGKTFLDGFACPPWFIAWPSVKTMQDCLVKY